MPEAHAPRRTADTSERKVVYAALAGNLCIAVTKFGAAWWTGSTAMLSEGVHSLVDTTNEVLLLYGMRRAKKAPDAAHPFGYGRELYFWSFVVALLVLTLGAGVAIWQGVHHLREPEPMRSPWVNYAVLGASLLFEGATWRVAFRRFRKSKGEQTWFEAFRSSKDASTITVLLEDTAAIAGLAIAFAGIVAAQLLDAPALDGAASIGIGLVLVAASVLLLGETKALLIGEAARPQVRADILRIAEADEGIRSANGVLTSHMGPRNIVAALSAEFEDHLDTRQIEACITRVEAAIKQAHPAVRVLFVKPQTPEAWRARMRGDGPEA